MSAPDAPAWMASSTCCISRHYRRVIAVSQATCRSPGMSQCCAMSVAAARISPIEPRVEDPAADARDLQRQADRVARGGARAAVLGVNDGLVSNLSLILGVAGASAG